jgi:hypothetical protein
LQHCQRSRLLVCIFQGQHKLRPPAAAACSVACVRSLLAICILLLLRVLLTAVGCAAMWLSVVVCSLISLCRGIRLTLPLVLPAEYL